MHRSFFRLPLDVLSALILLLLFALVLLSLQNPTSLDDGLRHFTMAAFFREQGIGQVAGWSGFLYEGYLNAVPVDPWFLSDVLLMPFTVFPIAKGLQLFIVCELALLLTAFLLVLRSLHLSPKECTLALLLLVFGDTQFMGRFLLGRPYALMTAMMLLVLWSILERRFVWLAVFIAESVLLSQLFVFGLLVCACALAAFLLTRRFADALKLGIATLIGLSAGFLLHPQPALYIQYLLTAFLRIPFLQSIGLSREMQSSLLTTSYLGVFLIIAFGGLTIVHVRQRALLHRFFGNAHILLLTILSSVLLLAFIIWIRAIDSLWPVLLVWGASVYMLDRSFPRTFVLMLFPMRTRGVTLIFSSVIIAASAQALSLPVMFIRDDASHSLAPYQALNRLPAGARVLNLDWEKFFAYVAVRPDLQYSSGIDRAFTYLIDPVVSKTIYDLELGSAGTIAMPDIQKSLATIFAAYPSDYMVISHKKFSPVIRILESDVSFERLSDNGVIAVYAVPGWYQRGR